MEESLPNIKGKVGSLKLRTTDFNAISGFVSSVTIAGNIAGEGIFPAIGQINFDAHNSSPTYQDNAHVRPLSIATAFLIRY